MRKIKKFLLILTNFNFILGLINNIAASVEHVNFIKKIKVKTVIDIGSNKGQFLLLCSKYFPYANFFSFEPQLDQLEIQKKFFRNKIKIKFFNFALGETEKISILYVTSRKDSSSMYKINKKLVKNKDYEITEKKEIKIKKISNILKKKDLKKNILVKIDVQGYELNVIKGFEKLITEVKYLLIEVSNNEVYKKQPKSSKIIKYLKRKKFKIASESNWIQLDKSNVKQKDILFINEKL